GLHSRPRRSGLRLGAGRPPLRPVSVRHPPEHLGQRPGDAQPDPAGGGMIRRILLLAGISALVLIAAGCTSSGSIEVSEARIGQPTGPNAALYLTATSGGEEDSLIAATSEVAERVELHETAMTAEGTMTMEPVES